MAQSLAELIEERLHSVSEPPSSATPHKVELLERRVEQLEDELRNRRGAAAELSRHLQAAADLLGRI